VRQSFEILFSTQIFVFLLHEVSDSVGQGRGGNVHSYQIPWVICAAEVQDLHLRELYPIAFEC